MANRRVKINTININGDLLARIVFDQHSNNIINTEPEQKLDAAPKKPTVSSEISSAVKNHDPVELTKLITKKSIACRANGHKWRHSNDKGLDKTKPGKTFTRTEKCTNCGTYRVTRVNLKAMSAKVVGYDYADGYQIPPGHRRLYRSAAMAAHYGVNVKI